MLLARKGYKVLVVDRATFPSDTISTHLVHPPGVAALSGGACSTGSRRDVRRSPYSFDFGPFTITGAPGTDAAGVAYGPRRTVLDKLLVDAASEAGAEVREGFTVEEVLVDDGRVTGIRGHGKGGQSVTERARVVIGADGRHSLVARSRRPRAVQRKAAAAVPGTTATGAACRERPLRGLRPPATGDSAAWPTHDGLTLVIVRLAVCGVRSEQGGHRRELPEDVRPGAADFAERVRAATREERFVGTAVPNYFRKPFGPGWALVGDAGYNKDFITAQGIQDAFRDAELCTTAIDDAFSGGRAFDAAMGDYQTARDAQVLPMYEFTAQLASLAPPPPELQQVLGAVHGNQEAMDGFARVNAGVTSPAEFFSEESVGRILTAAGVVS